MAEDDDLLPDLDPEALARAEAALQSLSAGYLGWAEADVASLRAGLAEMGAHPGRRADILPRLFRVAHDMKGQAATFDYPLVSDIGNRLCRFIEAHPQPDIAAEARITLLVEAIAEVLDKRLSGDGGAPGRALLDRLG
ncbi:Hpt domain-containing protein [Magnetospirillum sp. UT-4]|uniref:Hpt domain-containing protein n=1 Tax=Magnetospirillum sp. UT-4 TaxID=2681467 RepID=UPI0013849402|nr:Hpt domain-containing protein [Magnetospirillum sp. UT-4]CAA7616761.1 conserved hypothetical protein [Magnetospirillum sp. UT-4]